MGIWSTRARWSATCTGLAISAGLIAASCANLQEQDTGVCGNRVYEEEAGEDCDSYADPIDPDAGPDDPKTACGAPTSVGACRFLCDGNKTVCPPRQGLWLRVRRDMPQIRRPLDVGVFGERGRGQAAALG